jgi:hypothetical protein
VNPQTHSTLESRLFHKICHSTANFRKIAKDLTRPFQTLNPKSWDLNSRLGGCGISVINGNFFQKDDLNFKWKFEKFQKTELTLRLICQFTLRLGGYSIWSASTSRTIYIKKNSGLEHFIVLTQPRKYSEDYSKRPTDSEDGQQDPEALKALVDQTTESRSSRSTR